MRLNRTDGIASGCKTMLTSEQMTPVARYTAPVPPLKIELKASRMLTAVLAFAHITVAALLLASGLEAVLAAPLMALLLAGGWRSIRHSARLMSSSCIVALEVTSDSRLSARMRNGRWMACEVLGTTFVASRLTLLNLRERGSNTVRHVVVAPDGIDDDDFRKLRVWLRWRAAEGAGDRTSAEF
jgi:toxin CptA